MNSLRILSLLPAATEIVYLLGLEKYLVGVSHECDFPPEVKSKPKVTFSKITNAMSSREIDEKVKDLVHRDPGVFHIKERVLKKLRPNLILTQELCEVCAVGFNHVKKAARVLESSSKNQELRIISLEPESVGDILENILLVGEVTGYRLQAQKEVKKLRKRLDEIKTRLLRPFGARNDGKRPRVCVVEWLDPIMVAGHWVPHMIEIAGGINLITKAGEKSKRVAIDQIIASKSEILIISPCGFDIQRTIKQKRLIDRIVRGVRGVYLMDGNAYMTRPGPRIIDGIEILAEIFHSKIFPRKHSEKDWVEFIC